MSEAEFLPLSRHLLSFIEVELDEKHRLLLGKAINYLYLSLDKGHSCVSIDELALQAQISWTDLESLLLQSGLASRYTNLDECLPARPLTIFSFGKRPLVYLSKYFYYEINVARQLQLLHGNYELVNHHFYPEALVQLRQIAKIYDLPNHEQLKAIENSAHNKFSIITGGPGTGKTTTVTSLLWLLGKIYPGPLTVKVAAPTGKAANRVRGSIRESINNLQSKGLSFDSVLFTELLNDTQAFVTIHKLLGYQRNSIHFRYNKTNPLPVDILIIDESSMIGLPLFSKLVDAINISQIKHIIFLGDSNQLSSVEEGYVFASLVTIAKQIKADKQPVYDLFSEEPASILCELIQSKRTQGDVGKLAQAILSGDRAKLGQILIGSKNVQLQKLSIAVLMEQLLVNKDGGLVKYFDTIRQEPEITPVGLIKKYNRQVVLALTNTGIFGVDNLNYLLEKRIRLRLSIHDEWYTGRPIMILENDYSLGLYNGDIGITYVRSDKPVVVFENGDEGSYREFIPEILPKYRPAYAITIHKSQGSEYEHVNIVLPDLTENSLELLSRELVYTAVTRAKFSVSIFSSIETLNYAIDNTTERNSGLTELSLSLKK